MHPAAHPTPHRPSSSPLSTLVSERLLQARQSPQASSAMSTVHSYDTTYTVRGRDVHRTHLTSLSPSPERPRLSQSPSSDVDFFGIPASPTPRSSLDDSGHIPVTIASFCKAATVLGRPLAITSFGRTQHYPSAPPSPKSPIALSETFGHYTERTPRPQEKVWAFEHTRAWAGGRSLALALLRATGRLNDKLGENAITRQVDALLKQIIPDHDNDDAHGL